MEDRSISLCEKKRREDGDCNLLDDLSRGPVGFGASLLSQGSTWVQGRTTILKLTNQRLSRLLSSLHTYTYTNTHTHTHTHRLCVTLHIK
jgi:hypothetical protein